MKEAVGVEKYQDIVKEEAENYYRQGLNCAECAFKSYLDLGLTNFPSEVVALASGFGGGIGSTKNTCGALLGAALAVGSKKGRKDPLAKPLEQRSAELNGENGIYPIFYKLVKDFEAKYGTILCRELTAPYEDFHSKERRKNCQEIIGFAAGLGVKYALTE